MVPRRLKVALVVACAAGVAYAALPTLFAHRIRTELAELGYPAARLDVESVGWDHLQLRDVHLAEGIEFGALELDRGVSLLWSKPEVVLFERARVSTAALARTASAGKRASSAAPPFRRAVVRDSIVDVDGKPTRVAGRAAVISGALEVSVTVRDPSPKGWSARGRGRIVWKERVALEGGHISVEVPRHAVGGARLERARVEANVSGDLSGLELRGSGTARFARIAVGDVDVARVTLPFVFDRRRIQVGRGHGSTAGGELSLDPFVLRDQPVRLTLRARGLRLARLLQPTGRVTGSGLIDGFLTLHVGEKGLVLDRGELRARQPGTIQLAAPIGGDAAPFGLHEKVVGALADFKYDMLVAELAPPGVAKELTLSTRGRGRHNRQELDIAVTVRGLRELAARLIDVRAVSQ